MTSVSNGDDVSMTPSTQNRSNKVNYSTLVKENPLEGKTTVAVEAVMRGKSKHGYFFHVREDPTTQLQLVYHALALLYSFLTTAASPTPKFTPIACHTQV
jgi:hypothetical protein